ncbi:MAG: HAMP domain-containing sensor histidine kinase [Polyangiaceae bacterium]
MEERRGIRVQIVLALGTLMALAFVPLSFAVASLASASELVARRQAIVAVAHAIATHVKGDSSTPAEETLAAHLGESGIDALAVVKKGKITASAGEQLVGSDFGAPGSSRSEAGKIQASAQSGDVIVVARAPASDGSKPAPIVRLVALTISLFAVTLLVFMYFTLTRVIVRPLEALVAATSRVARGSRVLVLRQSGPRELADVAASVETMAAKLIADEATLLVKIDELTQTTKRLTEAQTQVIRSERMASVGRLAAGVAHEIGNPIAALLGMEDLLLDSTTPPDEARDFLVRMKRETERISTILRDLLDFARPEEKPDSSGQFSPAEVSGVIDEVLALSRPQKNFREIDLKIEIEQSLHVMMSTARLTQVLLNLMMNAAAALDSHKAPQIVVRAKRDDDNVRIEIEDNGPGVRADVRDQIFEPFVTTKEVGQGTGLGLSVCRGLVEAAGGTIEVDANAKSGARFVLILPGSD